MSATLALEMPADSTLPLRPYQAQALDAIGKAYARGVTRQLVVLPTGSGKTIVFSSLVSRRPGRALILAHRDELIQQAAQKLTVVSGSLDVGIVKARQDDRGARVVVASVQTLAQPGRVERLGDFATVIVDEAHHAVASTYMDILERLGCMGQSGPLTAGFTATAGRSDKVALGAVWQEVTYQRGIIQMIAEGYLCDIRAMQIGTDFDLGNVQVRAGDYTDSSIGAELERSDALDAAVKAYRQHAAGRLAVAFTPTIATAHALAEKLRAGGVPAEAVSGKTPTDERRAILARLHRGETRVVANAQVLIEGWDEPAVSCALMLRPTKSAPAFCLDAKTEILTDQGWKGIADDLTGALPATYDLADGSVSWSPLLGRIERPMESDEGMYALTSPTADIRVSDQHRMIWRHQRGQWQVSTASELAARHPAYKIPIAGYQKAAGVPLTDDELRFIGWFITDGSLSKTTGSITITQAEHQPWNEDITACLEGCGFKYAIYRQEGGSQYQRTSAQLRYTISKGKPRGTGTVEMTAGSLTWLLDLIFARLELTGAQQETLAAVLPEAIRTWEHLRGWGALEPYIDKDLSPALEDVTREQLAVLLEALHLGDGVKNSGGPGWVRRSYHISTGNRVFADRMQSLCVRRGFKCNVATWNSNQNPLYVLHVKDTAEKSVVGAGAASRHRERLTEVPSAPRERVWCIETDAGTIITRRHGKVAILGNCQMAGRILRPFVGKDDALLLDLTDSAQLGLATIATLAGLPPGSVKKGQSLLDAAEEQSGTEKRKIAVAAARTRHVDLLRRSDLHWLEAEGSWVLPAGADQTMVLIPAPGDGLEDSWNVWRFGKDHAPLLESGKPLTLDWARGVGEEVARANGGVLSQAKAAWRDKPPSPAQAGALERMGYADKLAGLTRGGAADLMTAHFAAKDIRRLRKAAR
jgi:superfamily II DNA or RNA helicase